MFNRKDDKRTQAEKVIDDRIDALSRQAQTPDEVRAVLECMKATEEEDAKKHPKISKDTWVTIGSNLLMGCLVLGFERTHIITTKLWSFITRRRT